MRPLLLISTILPSPGSKYLSTPRTMSDKRLVHFVIGGATCTDHWPGSDDWGGAAGEWTAELPVDI